MSDLWSFALAVLALLAVPGPTNTLMAASGATRGVVASLRLILGELGGYFVAITAWIELVGAAGAAEPMVGVIARLIACAFLVWSGYKLWVEAGAIDLPLRGITLKRVFLTTLLNPKALVFAFVIFPVGPFVERGPYLTVFVGLVVVTATGWMVLGRLAALGAGRLVTPKLVERVTAVALAGFATTIVVQTIDGLI